MKIYSMFLLFFSLTSYASPLLPKIENKKVSKGSLQCVDFTGSWSGKCLYRDSAESAKKINILSGSGCSYINIDDTQYKIGGTIDSSARGGIGDSPFVFSGTELWHYDWNKANDRLLVNYQMFGRYLSFHMIEGKGSGSYYLDGNELVFEFDGYKKTFDPETKKTGIFADLKTKCRFQRQ